MPLITRDSLERVKAATDMVEVVSAYTDLRQQGQRYTGLCPFHEERTASFSVDPVAKVYYCFGCEAGGDVFKFIEETESLEFNEAVERLADRFAVTVEHEQEDPGQRQKTARRERAFELLDKAVAFYERYLWESEEGEHARSYLKSRGLEEPVLRSFHVGYAPSKWDRLFNLASGQGFQVEEIEAAGLLARGKQGGPYDRFRARIMFPLTDARGRTLGFGARAVRESQMPKYVNSPESVVYHKSRALFGIDRARTAANKRGVVLVVEGYTDVLAMHQVGFENAVAIMGTALTDEQISELGRLATKVVLALDADSAGQKAMLRALSSARARRLDLKVMRLPDDKDPCDLLQAGGARDFERRVEGAQSFLEFQVDAVLERSDLDSARERDSALDELRPIFGAVSASAERDEQLRRAAAKLKLPEHLLVSLGGEQRSFVSQGRSEVANREEAMERAYLSMCLGVNPEEVGDEYLRKVERNHFSSELLLKTRDLLLEHRGDAAKVVDPGQRELVELISEIVVRSDQEPASRDKLEATFLSLELRRLDRVIAQAKEKGDFELMSRLAYERQEVKQAVDTATGVAI